MDCKIKSVYFWLNLSFGVVWQVTIDAWKYLETIEKNSLYQITLKIITLYLQMTLSTSYITVTPVNV